jgi:phosphocarrier protein
MRNMNYTFSTVEELIGFVGRAEKCNFDIKLIYEQLVLDGKSLMGALVIGIGKPVEIVCYDTEVSPEDLVNQVA